MSISNIQKIHTMHMHILHTERVHSTTNGHSLVDESVNKEAIWAQLQPKPTGFIIKRNPFVPLSRPSELLNETSRDASLF